MDKYGIISNTSKSQADYEIHKSQIINYPSECFWKL